MILVSYNNTLAMGCFTRYQMAVSFVFVYKIIFFLGGGFANAMYVLNNLLTNATIGVCVPFLRAFFYFAVAPGVSRASDDTPPCSFAALRLLAAILTPRHESAML